MPRFVQKTATILAGQSLSSTIDCSTGAPIMIHMSDQWTPSRLSFQVSPDGTNFYDLFDRDTLEMVLNVVAGTSVALEPGLAPVSYLKVRSGSREHPVTQEADRQIVITIDTSSAAAVTPRRK
jgi:hypothetical protein